MNFDIRTGARRSGIPRAGALAALLAAFVLIATTTPSMAAEEGTVEAFSSWEASGHIYPTGVEESTFVGVLCRKQLLLLSMTWLAELAEPQFHCPSSAQADARWPGLPLKLLCHFRSNELPRAIQAALVLICW